MTSISQTRQCLIILLLLRIDIYSYRILYFYDQITGICIVLQGAYLFRFVRPAISQAFAVRFDRQQIETHSLISNVPVTPDVEKQIMLPFSAGGHGLTVISTIYYAAYATSLVNAAPLLLNGPSYPIVNMYRRFSRRPLLTVLRSLPPQMQTPEQEFMWQKSDFGPFTRDALPQRPEPVHEIILQAGDAPVTILSYLQAYMLSLVLLHPPPREYRSLYGPSCSGDSLKSLFTITLDYHDARNTTRRWTRMATTKPTANQALD